MDGGDQQGRAPVVLGAKVRPPSIGGLWLSRFDALAARVDRTGVAVLAAPAGSGKTTFLTLLAQRAGSRACWYRAEAADGDQQTLALHLQRSLTPVLPPAPSRTWTTIDDVITALDDLGSDPVLLVVDDVDTLAGSPAAEALGRLTAYRPQRLVLAFAGRAEPPFAVDRARLQGRLVDIGPEELRFRPWEVETLFRDVYGEPLRPEDAARLTSAVHGWAAGLQLFHLATAGKPPAARLRMLEQLSGRSPLVRDYLTRNVVAELPDELSGFLRATIPLTVLSASVCDRFLGGRTSEDHLRELARRGVFTSSDDGGVTYHYHEVLRSWLDGELLASAGLDGAAAAYQRAGEILEEEGLVEGAVRAYCRAGCWPSVERLLAEIPAELPAHAVDWFSLLPTAISDADPWVLAARGRLLLRQARFAEALELYERAEQDRIEVRREPPWRRVRLGLMSWLGSPSPQAADWPAVLREATRSQPRAAAERLATRREPAWLVAAAAASVLGAQLGGAVTLAEAGGSHPDAGPDVRALARLIVAIAHLLSGAPDAVLSVRAAVADAADAGLGTAIDLVRATSGGVDPEPGGAVDPTQWPAAIGDLLAGWLALVSGGDARAAFARAGHLLDALDAPVLRAWAATGAAAAIGAAVDSATLKVVSSETAAAMSALGSRWGAGVADEAPTHTPPGLDLAGAARRANRSVPGGVLVGCLGPFFLTVDGTAVSLAPLRPRARQVLKLLVAHAPIPVHREVIIEAMWPACAPAAGTHRLQVAVSSLRSFFNTVVSGLGDRIVRRSGEAYAFAAADAECDCLQARAAFRGAAAADRDGEWAAATAGYECTLALFRALPLIEDGAADWAVAARAPLVDLALVAARRLAAIHRAAGAPGAAAVACERALALDPYDDGLWRLHIEALDAHGDRLAVTKARQRHTVLLDLIVEA